MVTNVLILGKFGCVVYMVEATLTVLLLLFSHEEPIKSLQSIRQFGVLWDYKLLGLYAIDVWAKKREMDALEDEVEIFEHFLCFFPSFFLVYSLSGGFKVCWESFWIYQPKPPFRQLRSC